MNLLAESQEIDFQWKLHYHLLVQLHEGKNKSTYDYLVVVLLDELCYVQRKIGKTLKKKKKKKSQFQSDHPKFGINTPNHR